ncbi:type VII secretion protein EccCb [Actinokineospora xionganensis]|uniref:Type VII secretion protein EccCb n=1 Tax=Actinokineospora xionganensis TaxID=2684470 RepID=A0ABR7LFC0_9PSEU|nr:type VII secretion protein EccCb [Actinokineospora xionganensis]MBC6451424.1 type VII secretion protein EccCb [Actinokineospora xionganensis]
MGERHALLVATARYADPKLRNLRAPVQETQLLAQLLLDPAIGEFDSAPVLLDNRKAVIEYEIERLFNDRSPDDLVLLYLSGHGFKNADNQLFFAANDTETNRPYSTAIPSVMVRQLLSECQSRNKAVLLDCCYSGMFSRGAVAKSTEGVDLDASLGMGTYVITATNELDLAYEDERVVFDRRQPYSRFTDALISGLTTGAAAPPGAEIITADDLYAYLYAELRKNTETERPQLPTRFNDAQGTIKIANARSRRLVVDESASSPQLADLIPAVREAAPTGMVVPIGQAHHMPGRADDVVRLDLAGHDGHIGIVGKIWSGKSALLHTLIAGLQFDRSADEVHFYCLDSGGQFSSLRAMPHVKEIVAPFDHAGIKAVLDRVEKTISTRDRLFRGAQIGHVGQFRELRRRGMLPAADNGDVFLVVDGWDQFAEEVPDLPAAVKKIAATGLSVGVHVLVTARHWAEIPQDIARLLRARIELCLDDPAESKIDPALAATLPDRAGWGLFNGRTFLAARTDPADTEAVLLAAAERLAGALTDEAPTTSVAPRPSGPPRLLPLLGMPDDPARFDLSQAWRPRAPQDRLCVPFAVDEAGIPVALDIKEAAMNGMGPHGLCIGATGSGKSELLRTIVLGLMATHSSTELNFVLVDFKGGATFLGLDKAPHVAATITNLAAETDLVNRLMEALTGELNRRQEQLRLAGNFANAREYGKAREHGAPLDPLPALFIVVDEFSELLSANPDFIDLFVMIGRIGRSLGIHLLLASQRLEEGRLRGLESHLSYRIVLRTFSAMESRTAIGVPDAYELPLTPGVGLMQVGNDPLRRFTAAYVSGHYGPADTDGPRPSELDVLVDQLVGQGPPAHEVWLPPLYEPSPLDHLLPPVVRSAERGLCASANGSLRLPVGLVDNPFAQRRDVLLADLAGAGGHVGVVGGPQSGKSTMLQTLILSTALTHTPQEAQFYCLDFGGGALSTVAGLPHVGDVATRLDRAKVRRTVSELTGLVRAREARFRELGIDSIADFRARKARGEPTGDPFGDVFLVIDGWTTVRNDFEELERQILDLAGRGLGYGVHVVVTANRWADIRPTLKDQLGTRFELRLGDPSESEVNRRVAVTVPTGRPGRGLTSDELHFLTALPRLDSGNSVHDVALGLRKAVAAVAEAWPGWTAPAIKLLPEQVDYHALRDDPVAGRLIPLGLDEDNLANVYLDFRRDAHFLAFADNESGKTNLLRTITRGITDRYSPKEAVILMVDFRRTMLGFVKEQHLIGYAVSANQLESMIKDVRASLAKRLPRSTLSHEELRNRSWWTGPELFIIVDDYDLVAAAGAVNPLQPLAEFLPQAVDVGLHLVVARRTGGAAKSLFDPIVGKLRELSTPGIVMSGSRDEGVLLGSVRPSALPPGRGTLVRRREGESLIQVAWTPEHSAAVSKG